MGMSARYAAKNCKTVLGDTGILNTRFWTRHCFDPYDNCEFNCVYCNTASRKLCGSKNLAVPVFAKVNAPQLLTKELTHLKKKGVVNIGLAMDPYQPAEKKYRLTQQILKILKDNNVPFAIGTKSDLVLRDLNLIADASKKTRCSVSVTITTLDEKLAKILEPNAPPPKRRLTVLNKLASAGIQTGVWITPIIPYITDTDENLERIIKASVENGAMYVLGGALDMRNPRGFYSFLKQRFPSLIPKYDKLYKVGEKRYTYYPKESYLYGLYKRFIAICKKYQVKSYMPHFHTRKQGMLFYLRNYLGTNSESFHELLPILNYLPPTQELLQTVQLRCGNWRLSKNFLKLIRYFPH